MLFDWLGHSGRRRLVLAFVSSLLMHAGLVTIWVKTGVRSPRSPHAPLPAENAIQWVDVAQVAPARAPERSAAPRPLRAAVPRAVPAELSAPTVAAKAPSGFTEAEPRMAAEYTASLPGVAALPRPGASSPQPTPVPWDSEGIARALQRERTWQRRQAASTTETLTPQRAAALSGVRLGEGDSVHESMGGDGSRVSRVQGPAGMYCVRVPSANRLPDHGAAPRLAPVTNCL